MNRMEELSEDMGFNAFNHLLWFVIIVTLVAMSLAWMILLGLFHDETLFDEEYRSEGDSDIGTKTQSVKDTVSV